MSPILMASVAGGSKAPDLYMAWAPLTASPLRESLCDARAENTYRYKKQVRDIYKESATGEDWRLKRAYD